jgi:hypothetical protein
MQPRRVGISGIGGGNRGVYIFCRQRRPAEDVDTGGLAEGLEKIKVSARKDGSAQFDDRSVSSALTANTREDIVPEKHFLRPSDPTMTTAPTRGDRDDDVFESQGGSGRSVGRSLRHTSLAGPSPGN